MPLELSRPVFRWLKDLALLRGQTASNDRCEISYNDQLYFENGYLIGQLLKKILKSKGYSSEALMRIRKIAHISSNENWNIIKEIMEEIDFQQVIDPHNITLELIQNIIEYLFDHFCPKPESKAKKKEKKTYIDPVLFSRQKQLEQSSNLLQFYLLALTKVFHIPLEQCLGLLVNNCRYLKKIIIQGTSDKGFQPLISFYKLIAHCMPLINRLISQQQSSQASFMNCIGLAVLSQNQEVCDIGCIVIDNLESSTWLQQQGYMLLLRSPNDKVLDLLLRKINPNFSIIFNQEIAQKFPNQYVELANYAKLLQYLHKSIYCRQIFEFLPLSHYLQKAFEKFEPDNVKQVPKKIKLAAKNLLKVIVLFFWNKLGFQQKNRICLCLQVQFCQNEEQRILTLGFIFEMITELSIRQAEFVRKFYHIIIKYYNRGTIDIRSFILSNLNFLYQNNPDHFPTGFFLQTYQIVTPVQAPDYQLIEILSRSPQLKHEEVLMLLKICTIYYYQQLQAACFIVPIGNLLKKYTPIEWASQLGQEILIKWPSLPIPPFQMLPPNTNKIKFRSIGLKKKEMLQFTQLNRYKSILKLLAQVNNRQFLVVFGRHIQSTIKKVEKSKTKQMQNTKAFLNNLLAKVDAKKMEARAQKEKESLQSRSEAHIIQQQSDSIESDSYLQRIDDRDLTDLQTPIRRLDEQNEFIRPQQLPAQENPLLPFSQESIPDQNFRNYSDQALFQNYELIYVRNTAGKYEGLLKFIAEVYQKSANITHFLRNLNMFSYFENNIESLEHSQEHLKLLHESLPQISFKLTIEMALLLFEFKKSRRITIKCVQSFYQLLAQKCGYQHSNNEGQKSPEKEKTNLNAKIDFKYQISKKTLQSNHAAQKYMVCFDVVSQLLKKAIGVHLTQPTSCIVSQILPFSESLSESKLARNLEKSRVSQVQLRQYEQLQKMIENESRLQPSNSAFSSPFRRHKNYPPLPPNEKSKQQKPNQSEKWASIQKKVIMRRRQLQGRQKTINES